MSNWKPFVFASDIHGDEQDAGANRAFWRFMDLWKPKIRVLGGDLFDFRALRTKADEDEKRESMRKDFEAGREWLLRFAPQHFLHGNHDERLWYLREKAKGPLSDYAADRIALIDADCTKLKCRQYPYDKKHGIAHIGNLKCLHGYATGIGAARKHVQVYGSCVFGHGHSIQHASIEGVEDRVGRMAGCLCNLDLQYASTKIGALLWRHGWVYGAINERTGNYQAFQAECIEGKYLLAKELVEL